MVTIRTVGSIAQQQFTTLIASEAKIRHRFGSALGPFTFIIFGLLLVGLSLFTAFAILILKYNKEMPIDLNNLTVYRTKN